MPEADEFAVDAPVSPCRVVGGDLQGELADRWCGGRSSLWSVGLGPVTGDATPVPAQERVGRDEPAVASSAGERPCDRSEQVPVVIG